MLTQQETPNEAAPVRFNRGRLFLSTGIALALCFTILALAGDVDGVRGAFRTFDWKLAPFIIVLTCWNYGWRFLKWRRYLQALDIPLTSLPLDGAIYFGGYAMTITPGKVGEIVRAVQIKQLHGTPIARTSAAIGAERITDGAAMLVLATIGLLQFNYARPFVVAAFIAFAFGAWLIQHPDRLEQLLDRIADLKPIRRSVEHIRSFIRASGLLFRPRLLFTAIGISIVSWAGECIAFFLVLIGFGIDASWTLLLAATFILAVSSLAGGASLLPGGLGVTDATAAGMLLLLVDDPSMNRAVAAAATLVIRFATLWFGVGLGAICLVLAQRRIAAIERLRAPLSGENV